MKRNDEGGLDATQAEAMALAYYIVADLIDPAHQPGVEWEQYPELGEHTWLKVQAVIDSIQHELIAQAERFHSDPASLLGAAINFEEES